jgi:hypothetical protein
MTEEIVDKCTYCGKVAVRFKQSIVNPKPGMNEWAHCKSCGTQTSIENHLDRKDRGNNAPTK